MLCYYSIFSTTLNFIIYDYELSNLRYFIYEDWWLGLKIHKIRIDFTSTVLKTQLGWKPVSSLLISQLSNHPTIHPFIHSFINPSIHPFVHLSFQSFIFTLSDHLSIQPFTPVNQSTIQPSNHSSIHPSIHTCIHPIIHFYFIQPFIHSTIHTSSHSSIHLVFNQSNSSSTLSIIPVKQLLFKHSSIQPFIHLSFIH